MTGLSARLIFAALIGSTWFQISAASVAGLVALRVYNGHLRSVGAEQQRAANRKEVTNENALAERARELAEKLYQERMAKLDAEREQQSAEERAADEELQRQAARRAPPAPNDVLRPPAHPARPERVRGTAKRVPNPYERDAAVGK